MLALIFFKGVYERAKITIVYVKFTIGLEEKELPHASICF